LVFWPNEWQKEHSAEDVTDMVKAFYEQTPFPNYDDLDSGEGLREKARKGVFARLLDEQIPHGSKILEVGCGTGQLTNFLGLTWGRAVFGTDLCLNSLRLAQNFKEKNRIANAAFLQMNLFRPVFKPESFDLVVCNGVLHHTSDPFLGFQTISKLVKNDGFIVIGLYNTYGRLFTDSRRAIFRLTGNRLKFLDPHLRNRNVGKAKKNAWFMDQYKHPHESKHTIGEVIEWFDSSGFEFVNSIPKATAFSSFQENEKLFEANPAGSAFDHFLVQLGMVLTGGREGGFYLMIGRKTASSLAREAVAAPVRTARAGG
jgi:SAM-dependent methyltransferase